MSALFFFRPLNFEWRPEIRSAQKDGSALTYESYVDGVMMKLPAFPRSTPTLIIECGYTSAEKRLNLADEAFLGLVESRSLVVPTHDYINGGALTSDLSSSHHHGSPIKISNSSDVNLQGRLSIPYSSSASASPFTYMNNNNNNSNISNQSIPVGMQRTSYSGGSTAILSALEHRRRMRGDETFFGMIAFSNLARPPTDLVAPFRMTPDNTTGGNYYESAHHHQHHENKNANMNMMLDHQFQSGTPSHPVSSENFRISLAHVRNDEDLLRLYDEIQSSSAFRNAASRLSIVCFITATLPTDARVPHSATAMHSNSSSGNRHCTASIGSLVGTVGTDIVCLLQQEHHSDAMDCFGVDISAKMRRPDSSAVPSGLTAEHRRWAEEKRRQIQQEKNQQQQQQKNSPSRKDSNNNTNTSTTPSITDLQVSLLPSSAEILKCISSIVGVKGDVAVISRLLAETATADILKSWSGVSRDITALTSPMSNPRHPANLIENQPTYLEGQNNQQNNNTNNGTPTTTNNNKSASDWIIPFETTSRNELLQDQERQTQEELERKRKQQHEKEEQEAEEERLLKNQKGAGGASVTSFIQASSGIPSALKSAVSSEVDTLEQQVNLQRQALRWFQSHLDPTVLSNEQQQQQQMNTTNTENSSSGTFSPNYQMTPEFMLKNKNVNKVNNNVTTAAAASNANNSLPQSPSRSQVYFDSINQNQNVNTNNINRNATTTTATTSNSSPEPRRVVQNQTYSSPSGGGGFNDYDETFGIVDSPLISSPQAVKTRFSRAQQETESIHDNKSKWLMELDRVEVSHSSAVARRFQAARQLAEEQARVEELNREISELQQNVLQERQHVEEKNRQLIALRKQLDVSDGATKRAENQLSEVERQDLQKQRAETEEQELVASQRKHEIDAWYERAVTFQREAELQRASSVARHSAALADERRRKEQLASDKTRFLQEISQVDAGLRLNEVAVTEARRKIATTQTELQRTRSLHHELSITHQDIKLDSAVLQRLQLDRAHLQEQIQDMEKAAERVEEKNRMNTHTAEEVARFSDMAVGASFYSNVALLRSDETNERSMIVNDFMHGFALSVRNFVRQAIQMEDSALSAQLKNCQECEQYQKQIATNKMEQSACQTSRKQVATESLGKERQLEVQLEKYEKEMELHQQQRLELESKLQIHHTRHQAEREKTSQRLQALASSRDALLQEFFRQIDGETRRSVSQLVATLKNMNNSSSSSSRKNNNSSSVSRSLNESNVEEEEEEENAPEISLQDIHQESPAFAAAEYARWCDEISDTAAAEHRVHGLQERLNQAESASIVSSDNVAESRQLLLHLEHENEVREDALRALEKEVDSRRSWLKNRRKEIEESLKKEHQETEQRTSTVATQVKASTEAAARLKQTVKEERFRANALSSEIETVQTGSAAALLIRELNSMKDSNKARREILGAVNRVGGGKSSQHHRSSSSSFGMKENISYDKIERPQDLQQGTHFPPRATSEQIVFGDVGTNHNVPFYANSEARSSEMRHVPSRGEYQSAVGMARDLLERRSTLEFPSNASHFTPSPATTTTVENTNNNEEESRRTATPTPIVPSSNDNNNKNDNNNRRHARSPSL